MTRATSCSAVHAERRIRLRVILTSAALSMAAYGLGVAATGCIVGSNKCDEHQVPGATQYHGCVCEAGYVLSARGYGCEPCGSHEQVADGKCVCESGYVKDQSGTCEVSSGSVLGSDCSAEHACEGTNDYCALSETPPYCTTQDCSINDDCPSGWRCAQTGDPTFCQKPSEGVGAHCNSSADCTGTEAGFCDSFQSHTCVINRCLAHPSDCPSQSVCCDLRTLVNDSLCVPISGLNDGRCPDGMEPVTP
jgi:hypothetical protein